MNDSVKDIKTLIKFMWEIYKIRFMPPIILDERDETDNKRNPYWSSTINEGHGGQKMEESSIDKSNEVSKLIGIGTGGIALLNQIIREPSHNLEYYAITTEKKIIKMTAPVPMLTQEEQCRIDKEKKERQDRSFPIDVMAFTETNDLNHSWYQNMHYLSECTALLKTKALTDKIIDLVKGLRSVYLVVDLKKNDDSELIQTIASCVKAAGVSIVVMVTDAHILQQPNDQFRSEIITVLQETAVDRFQYWSPDMGFSDIDCSPKNFFAELLKMAEEGDALSQYKVGNAYYNGTQVPRDLDKAHEWLEKANKQWFYPAIFRLGDLYYETAKSKENKEKAARYWLVGYNGGKLIESAYRFAKNYRDIYAEPPKDKTENYQREEMKILCWYLKAGWYGVQDPGILTKAETYIEKIKNVLQEQFEKDLPLAESGNEAAQRRVSVAYQEGLIIGQDLKKADTWWAKAEWQAGRS